MIKTNFIRRFLKDTRGANLVEYIILVGVVALISIAAFKIFGSKVQEKIKGQGDTVGAINAGSGGLAIHDQGERVAELLGPRASVEKGQRAALGARRTKPCCSPFHSWWPRC